MMAFERFESARDNLGKYIYQFQSETKTLIRKLERILNKLYRQNLSLLFNEICLNERLLPNHIHTHTHTHTHIRIYIYIYMEVNNIIKSDNIKKKGKQSISNEMNLFMRVKST